MLSPDEIVDKDFLEHRYMLLEIAAYLDRYDAAIRRTGGKSPLPKKLQIIDQALELLRSSPSENGRTQDLLNLFATL